MNGDTYTPALESVLIALAERHQAAEWRVTDAGVNVLAIPLAELSKDANVDLYWKGQPLPGTTAVQLSSDPAAASGEVAHEGRSIAIPESSGSAGADYDATATIEIGNQRWTLYVAKSAPGLPGGFRLPEAPAPDEIEDLDARENWFKKRH